VVAVDKCHASACRASARLNDNALQGIVTTASDLLLPLAAESVDAVLATDLIEHVAEPEVMLREMSRVLKPGGVCLVSAAHRWSWENIVADPHWGLAGVALMPRWLGKLYVCRVRRRASDYDVWTMPTRSDIEKLMRKAGLRPMNDARPLRRVHSPPSVIQVWATKPADNQAQPIAARNLD
jgi:ubiquinone/menaquinone biosynthesis C-methylase UbiE